MRVLAPYSSFSGRDPRGRHPHARHPGRRSSLPLRRIPTSPPRQWTIAKARSSTQASHRRLGCDRR